MTTVIYAILQCYSGYTGQWSNLNGCLVHHNSPTFASEQACKDALRAHPINKLSGGAVEYYDCYYITQPAWQPVR